MPELLARAEADVLHLHAPNPTGEVSALIGARGRPTVFSYHADIVRQARLIPAYRKLIAAVGRRAHAVIVGSAATARSPFLATLPTGKIRHIPYGVDLDWFDPDAVPAQEIESLHDRYGGAFVLAVGRLVHYKGFEHLIAASDRVKAPVVIVGGGPLEPALRAAAAQRSNVHMAGRLDATDLRRHLAAATVFALPSVSRAESFGIATVEAQAMGLPAVVSDVGTGTVETIVPGETGMVVGPGDENGLADALARLTSEASLRDDMAAKAREHVRSRHDVRDQIAVTEALYEEAVAGT